MCVCNAHTFSYQVKPKKPVGMGFGNIFQGGVPTLKKNSNRFSFVQLFEFDLCAEQLFPLLLEPSPLTALCLLLSLSSPPYRLNRTSPQPHLHLRHLQYMP